MSINPDDYLEFDPKSPEGQAFLAGWLYANKDRLNAMQAQLDRLPEDLRKAVLVSAFNYAMTSEPAGIFGAIEMLTLMPDDALIDALNEDAATKALLAMRGLDK